MYCLLWVSALAMGVSSVCFGVGIKILIQEGFMEKVLLKVREINDCWQVSKK